MSDVVAGCFQFDFIPGEVERNVERLGLQLQRFQSTRCRLLVLPEMWAGGFAYSRLREMAEKTPGVIETLRAWAVEYGMVFVGSLPEADGESIYNTSTVIDADGSIAGTYRKVHLFSLHGEDRHFARGDSSLVCSTAVGKLGVLICYDLRFPEPSRRLALEGAEILCYSAQWPDTRIAHWSLLLQARAVENQMFVVGCNGCGVEGKLRYGGRSAIISPSGAVLAQAGAEAEAAFARLDFEEMIRFRTLIPCFSDRVPKAYGSNA